MASLWAGREERIAEGAGALVGEGAFRLCEVDPPSLAQVNLGCFSVYSLLASNSRKCFS